MADWLRTGLQIQQGMFDSCQDLQIKARAMPQIQIKCLACGNDETLCPCYTTKHDNPARAAVLFIAFILMLALAVNLAL